MDEKKRIRQKAGSEEFTDAEEKEPEDIYNEETREEMLEGDEITATEEGFMRGFEGEVEGGKKHKKDSGHEDTTSVDLAKDQYTED
ncbi:MAG TPA: hypothetical protein VGK23_03540 [Methanomassiliicoccales archaeon]|jgi:hypothetical protein